MDTGNLLVDTSIIIDHFRKQNKKNSQLYSLINTHNLFVSSLTLYELFAGATNDTKRKDIRDLITILTALPFTSAEAELSVEIFIALKSKNKLIDIADILIGATALTHNLAIATLNVKHFERIENLVIF